MILVDVNLLVYARIGGLPQSEPARGWLDGALNGGAMVGLPWPVLLGFVRLTTNRRVFGTPLPLADAWAQVQEWLALTTVWIPTAGARHASVLDGVLRDAEPGGDLVPDAHLAALAVEHGLELCSTDRDFARFSSLRWRDPLRS